jgi:prophage endopeptidase
MPIKLLLLIGALVAGFLAGHHQAEIEQEAAHVQALEQAQEREHELILAVNDISAKYLKAQEDAETRKNTVTAGIRSGAVRLSIPTAACGGESAATASGNRAKARTELDRQTAESLVSIASDGDRAIRQLNACIDAYNKVTE